MSFTRIHDGDVVSAPDSAPFVADSIYFGGGFVPIFWEGRNDPRNSTADLEATVSNIAAQVAISNSSSYLVMNVLNSHLPGEAKGEAGYPGFLALDAMMEQAFPNHYLDIRNVLVSSYDPTNAIDVTDYNNGVPPTSLNAVQGTATLASDIDNLTSTITVNVTAGYVESGYMLNVGTGADAESMRITSVSGNTVTATRGAGGNQEAHSAGSAGTCTDELHLNGKGYQIVANAVHQWFQQHL